jgi:hypothetical protein
MAAPELEPPFEQVVSRQVRLARLVPYSFRSGCCLRGAEVAIMGRTYYFLILLSRDAA